MIFPLREKNYNLSVLKKKRISAFYNLVLFLIYFPSIILTFLIRIEKSKQKKLNENGS